MVAVHNNHPECVQLLLNDGAKKARRVWCQARGSVLGEGGAGRPVFRQGLCVLASALPAQGVITSSMC